MNKSIVLVGWYFEMYDFWNMIWVLNFVALTSCIQASQSMDPTQSQDPFMEDDGLQFVPSVVEIAAIEHGLQGEVIALLHVLFVCIFMTMWLYFGFLYLFAVVSFFFWFPCRMRYRFHKTVLLTSLTQRWLSSRDEICKKRIRTMSFIGLESNLLISHGSLFLCVACDVFLLFGPSTRLMSLGWEISLSWVTVTVTVLCTCLPTTTLIRSSMFPTISWPLGVHYG